MDFTGLSVLALLFGSQLVIETWRVLLFFDRGCLETPGVRQIAGTARDDEGHGISILKNGQHVFNLLKIV